MDTSRAIQPQFSAAVQDHTWTELIVMSDGGPAGLVWYWWAQPLREGGRVGLRRPASIDFEGAGDMNIKKLLVDFVTVFAVSLVVTVIVTLLWNLIAHGATTIDWETSFRFAILFGILFSWIEARRRSEK
jgi:hypothetical protein